MGLLQLARRSCACVLFFLIDSNIAELYTPVWIHEQNSYDWVTALIPALSTVDIASIPLAKQYVTVLVSSLCSRDAQHQAIFTAGRKLSIPEVSSKGDVTSGEEPK